MSVLPITRIRELLGEKAVGRSDAEIAEVGQRAEVLAQVILTSARKRALEQRRALAAEAPGEPAAAADDK